jgi:hypothetical protein
MEQSYLEGSTNDSEDAPKSIDDLDVANNESPLLPKDGAALKSKFGG